MAAAPSEARSVKPHPFDPSYTHPDKCVICKQPEQHANHITA